MGHITISYARIGNVNEITTAPFVVNISRWLYSQPGNLR